MANKSDFVVTLTTNVVKKEKWLIENETEEDAIWIAENMNQSKLYNCTLLEENQEEEDFDFESASEVVFTKRTDFKGQKENKYFWKEIE